MLAALYEYIEVVDVNGVFRTWRAVRLRWIMLSQGVACHALFGGK